MNHLEATMPAEDQLASEKPAINEPSRLRRNFLLGTTLSAASAAVAAVAVAVGEGKAKAKAAIEVAQNDAVDSGRKKIRGYHLSEHIAQYYDTTRI